MKLTIVPDNNPDDDNAEGTRQICYNVEYRPDPNMCRTKGRRLIVNTPGANTPSALLLQYLSVVVKNLIVNVSTRLED